MYAAIAVGIVIIGMSIFFVYSSEQAKTRGQAFGKSIEFLQEDLRNQTHLFDSKISMFKRGDIGKDEFLESTKNHENNMEKLLLQYFQFEAFLVSQLLLCPLFLFQDFLIF